MSDIFLKWLIPFICGGAVSICGMLVAGLKKNKKKKKSVEEGLQCLLRAEIIRSYEKYTEKGFCPIYAKEALKREYDAYHNLGGNDVATELYQKMKLLSEEPPKESGRKYEKQ